jgi:hypothetical protein
MRPLGSPRVHEKRFSGGKFRVTDVEYRKASATEFHVEFSLSLFLSFRSAFLSPARSTFLQFSPSVHLDTRGASEGFIATGGTYIDVGGVAMRPHEDRSKRERERKRELGISPDQARDSPTARALTIASSR